MLYDESGAGQTTGSGHYTGRPGEPCRDAAAPKPLPRRSPARLHPLAALELISALGASGAAASAPSCAFPRKYSTYFYYATLPLPGLLTSPGASMLRAREIPAAG